MKPLRTGLGAGLLAGGAVAANKLLGDWRAGAGASARVLTGGNGKTPAKGVGIGGGMGGVTDAVGSLVARRAARRAEVNRPAWVVAAVPGTTVTVAAPPRPAPAPPRRLPTLESLRPPSAKAVGVSVGKYAVKQAGRAIGKAAADRVGKAIEVIEVLEKVVASASSQAASKPDTTPSGPGAATLAVVVPGPVADVPSAGPTGPKVSRGTLVSVRKFERGPRVVVGPGVKLPGAPPEAEADTESPLAGDAAVEAAVEVVVEAVEVAVTEAAAETAAAQPAAAAPPKPAAPKTATATPTTKPPTKAKAKAKAPAKKAAPKGKPAAKAEVAPPTSPAVDGPDTP